MRLKKLEREQVRMKYGGRCAYCGIELGDRWHADHMQSVRRGTSHRWEGNAERPQNHNLDNMMPACVPCNLSKSQMPLEAWRIYLLNHVNSLNLYHPIYRLAKAYGLVVETTAPVVFYFEKVIHEQH